MDRNHQDRGRWGGPEAQWGPRGQGRKAYHGGCGTPGATLRGPAATRGWGDSEQDADPLLLQAPRQNFQKHLRICGDPVTPSVARCLGDSSRKTHGICEPSL